MSRDVLLIVLCGLSFSGKSTIGRALAGGLEAKVVSLDVINEERGLRGGQGIPLEEWRRTNDLAHERVSSLLEAGRSVIVDDTSSLRFLRDEWRATAAAVGARFELVHVHARPESIRARIRANRDDPRRADVIDSVLEEHTSGFEAPAADEAVTAIATDSPDFDTELERLIRAFSADPTPAE